MIRRGCIAIVVTAIYCFSSTYNNPTEQYQLVWHGNIGHGSDILVEHRPCNRMPSLVPDNWCLDDSMVPRYMGDKDDVNKPIDVKLFTYDGFNNCLANKTVVFIGDSRVRYQYMHLASYLKTKKFMKCDDQSPYTNTKNDKECLLTYIDYAGKMVQRINFYD